MSAVRGHGRADVLHGAPFDLDLGSAAKNPGLTRRLAGTIRDIALIALAWTIFELSRRRSASSSSGARAGNTATPASRSVWGSGGDSRCSSSPQPWR